MIKKSILLPAVLASVLTTASCASTGNNNPHEDNDSLESYNRAVFKFNYQVDKYVLKPIAEGYRDITSESVRNRVNSFLSNIKEPLYAGNHLLQGNFKQAGIEVYRFAINTTLGIGGLFDVAEGWGFPKQKTNVDETLATWCVPDGPYFMLPFIGPSTPRAATGLVAETVFDPVYWATYNDANVRDKITYTYWGVKAIATREQALDLLNELERGSVDFYSTMRSAYLQNRKDMGCRSTDDNAQTYDFDFGLEDEDEAFNEMEDE